MRTTIIATSVLFCGGIFCGGIIATANAAEVKRSVSVDATAGEVWEKVGAVCAIADWYPGIDSCEEETIDGAPHRRLTTADGGVFLERMLGHDDEEMSYSYAIVEGPLPVADYTAEFSVAESDGRAVVSWESNFEPAGVSEAEAIDVMTGVYDTGLEAIGSTFAE